VGGTLNGEPRAIGGSAEQRLRAVHPRSLLRPCGAHVPAYRPRPAGRLGFQLDDHRL